MGLTAAGWDIVAQVEVDPDAAQSLRSHGRLQRRESLVIESRIEDVRPQELMRRLRLRPGGLGLLVGGPPCQPFTTSGLRRAIRDARASSLFPAYLEFVKHLSPRFLLIENVDGLLSAALRHRPLSRRSTSHPPLAADEMKGSFLKWLVDSLAGAGYVVSWGVVEAADYGVPQMRQRAIVIGTRSDGPCFLPGPRFGRPGLPHYRTLQDALDGLAHLGPVQPLSSRKQDVYRHIPPGGNWRTLSPRLQRSTMGAAFLAEGGKSGWWRRLSWDLPAPTILGMPDHSSTALIHPEETRCLSVNECAAVQTFPSWVQFAGSSRSQYQQIGNAVPPLLGQALGEHLLMFDRGERQPRPSPPGWRRASANRRIGTHGWALPRGYCVDYHLNVQVRPDHIWQRFV